MRKTVGGAALVALTALMASKSASAQVAGFGVDRFNPSERGSEWFVLDSLDMRGGARPAVGVVGEYAYKPLVVYDANGNERSAIVSSQFFLHAGASLVLGDRLRVAFNLPIAIANDGDASTVNGLNIGSPSHPALGDMRFSADLRLFGKYASPFSIAVGGQLFMPTGERSAYTGDGQAHGIVHALAAGEIGIIAYGARIGVHIRDLNRSFDGAPIGDEVIFGASVGVRFLERKLLVGPEIYGATGVSTSDAFFAKRSTPLEGIIGAHYTIGTDWRVGLGVGPGLNRGLGEPVVRVLGSIEWVPGYTPPPREVTVGDRDGDGIRDNRDACPDHPGPRDDDPRKNGCPVIASDRDGDGIADDVDACPDVKGIKTDDPKTNGCPPPKSDRDGDGIIDDEDACPDVKGVKTSDPKTNGCPADRDGDLIPDDVDACPDVKGVKTDDPKTNGCPPDTDRDKDGILNDDDACPDAAGPKNEDPKKNGCPAAAVVGDQIKIMDQVKFATGSAAILKESDAILNAVFKILTDHPEIKKVRIEGHTDNVGAAGYNKTLSGQRAASVMAWLVKKGIDKSRLSAQGFGMEKPIDDNKTDAGRKNNRRVEFHIE